MKRFHSIMLKYILPVALLASGSLFVTGCLRYAAEHPEKSHEQFLQDKGRCEDQAAEYDLLLRNQADHDYIDEVKHTRQCMEGLGWEYRFRWGASGQETAEHKSKTKE